MIGKMIKKFIKRIFYKIYTVGRYEDIRLRNEENKNRLKQISIIDPTVWLSDDASIENNSQPKEKIRIGSNSRIMGQIFLFDSDGEVVIGSDCFIGPGSKIWSAKRISIGDRVLIAHNVNIIDNISHPLDARLRYEENSNFVNTGIHSHVDIKASEIIIDDDVWIGFNCSIMRGVKIGKGAIIGSCSLVTKDIAPWTVNVGNPLRCIRQLDPVELTFKF
jgi:acetyltransferase-like isoleucine patch superfamily enzyme